MDSRKLHLLLVDDDVELCSMMQEYLGQMGHHLECAYNGREGLALALKTPYDIVLLDVMLPAINGFSVLQQLRRRVDVPVIMLTARVHRDDRIAGLNKGADDYLTKPFDPEELVARVYAILRRTHAFNDSAVRIFGELQVDVQRRQARIAGEIVELTGLEFDILEMLTRSPGRVVSRDEITETLLNRAASPFDRALDVHVSHLRDKCGRERILTMRGVGYMFAGTP